MHKQYYQDGCSVWHATVGIRILVDNTRINTSNQYGEGQTKNLIQSRNYAIESRFFPRRNWIHIHVTVRVQDDCTFTIYFSTRAAFQLPLPNENN